MRKYTFRKYDVVRERTAAQNPVVGRVIGFGSSAGHDWYKVASGGDVYNCRDDELELVRRGPAGREFPPIDENELERFVLIWRPMSVDPPKDAECLTVWRRWDGALREHVLRWDGERWILEYNGDKIEFDRESIDAWTLWEWPEIDGKEAGDHDTDPDDGQGRD